MSFVRDLKIAVGLVVAILAAVGGWSTIVLFQLASGSMTLADVSDGVVWLRQSWDAVGTWTARACAGGAVLRYALPALWRMALTKLTNSIRNIALDVMTTPNTPKQG